MVSINLSDLDATITKLQTLRDLSNEIYLALKLLEGMSENILPVMSDRLIRAKEAAKVLGVAKETIYRYVAKNKLPAYYTDGSSQMKFWLNDVKSLAVKGES